MGIRARTRSLLRPEISVAGECEGHHSDPTFAGKGVPRPNNAAAAYSLPWNQDSDYPGDEIMRSRLEDGYPKTIDDKDLERTRSDKRTFPPIGLPGVNADIGVKQSFSDTGKRNIESATKKRARSFIGKRNDLDYEDKRSRSYIGRRNDLDSGFEDKRSRPYIGQRNDLDYKDKRSRSFIGKRNDMDFEDKRGRSFIGKRNDLNSNFEVKRGRSFSGKGEELELKYSGPPFDDDDDDKTLKSAK